MIPTQEEVAKILLEWKAFAQTKVFAFRGISPAAYQLFAPGYFRSIIERSETFVLRDEGIMTACVVTEPVPDSNTTNVHWAWTEHKSRNADLQKVLWERSGLDHRNIIITHLTVAVERMMQNPRSPAHRFEFVPFTLYKEETNGRRQDTEVEAQAGDDESGERAELHR